MPARTGRGGSIVKDSYYKLMAGIPLSEKEIKKMEEDEYQARMEDFESEKKKRFLMDPNKTKGMSDVEKKMAMSKLYSGRRGREVFLGSVGAEEEKYF